MSSPTLRERVTWTELELNSSGRRPPNSDRSFTLKKIAGRKSSRKPAQRSIDEMITVTGNEHWTNKGAVRLFLWEKYAGTPEGKPAVLFVHGSSMASQPTFDLTVPGRADSSAMDWFSQRGHACWSVDMEGYGRSDKSRDIYCDIANGADDIEPA